HPIQTPPDGGGATVVNDGADTLTLAGNISGNGGLNKEFQTADTGGSGTVVLTGAQKTYLGATAVSHGTLRTAVSDVLPSGTTVQLFGGSAVLDVGTTTQHIGSVTMNKGAITGTSSGGLVATGTYDLRAGTVSAVLG